MTRPLASRFFSAFYRWNRHKSSPCLAAPRNSRSLLTAIQHALDPAKEGEDGNEAKDVPIRYVTVQDEHKAAEDPNLVVESAPQKPVLPLIKDVRLRDGVRGIMRKVPASVAILTVAHVPPFKKHPVPMGVAVSSLTTVSLNPPLISFNIKQPSQTLDAIRAAHGHFRVHFLRADRSGAKVVELFCNGNHTEAYKRRRHELKIKLYDGKRPPPPHIVDDAVQAMMKCTVTHEMTVGDHIVLVARVSDYEAYKDGDAAIAYVDGKYMRMDGEIISSHGTPAHQKDEWSPFEYPFLLGKKEQSDYVDRLKAMVRANPVYLELSPREVRVHLNLELGYPPNQAGIDVELLAATVQAEANRKPVDPSFSPEFPIVADFYGSLSESDIAQIVARAKALVRADPQCIEYLSWKQLLKHLGVSSSANIIPSDIMAPLREEGLVGPFEPRAQDCNNQKADGVFNTVYLEQTEHNVRRFIAELKYDEAEHMRFGRILTQVGEHGSIITQFVSCQTRLRYEGKPGLYDFPEIDLRGTLSREEARVALGRIVRKLRIDSVEAFRIQLEEHNYDRLVQVNVHPLVSGISTNFIFSKLQHIFYSTPVFDNVPAAIEKALDDIFADSITRPDLGDRVKEFVATHTVRATAWSTPDILAALGLRETATLAPATSEFEETLGSENTTIPDTPQPVAGLVLDTLIATHLRAQYSHGTPEADKAITRFLRERYGFDVVRNAPVEVAPRPPVKTAGREALDELERRMEAEMELDERVQAAQELQLKRKEVEAAEEKERREKRKMQHMEEHKREQEEKKREKERLQKKKEKYERELKEAKARAPPGKYYGLGALEELEKVVAKSEP